MWAVDAACCYRIGNCPRLFPIYTAYTFLYFLIPKYELIGPYYMFLSFVSPLLWLKLADLPIVLLHFKITFFFFYQKGHQIALTSVRFCFPYHIHFHF